MKINFKKIEAQTSFEGAKQTFDDTGLPANFQEKYHCKVGFCHEHQPCFRNVSGQ